jgi:hypothetical protein
MNGPMAQRTCAGEVQRAWCEWVGEVVAYRYWWYVSFPRGCAAGEKCVANVPIRGSWPGPLLLFAKCAVDEKEDVEAGTCACVGHCALVRPAEMRIEGIASGRKTGRNAVRFIFSVGSGNGVEVVRGDSFNMLEVVDSAGALVCQGQSHVQRTRFAPSSPTLNLHHKN